MKDTPLELASTAEIIEELLNRTTFAGVIVYCNEENRGQIHDHFGLHSALSIEDSTVLLEVALNALAQQKDQ